MSEVDDILERTNRALRTSYRGLKRYQNANGEEKIVGMHNAIVFGRSVTFVLHNMSGKVDGFDEWYDEKIEVLKEDPVCNKMKEIRNKIEKEGGTDTTSYMKSSNFDITQIQSKMPPFADRGFVDDQYGGSGYVVKQPDGTEEKFYFDFDLDGIETGRYIDERQKSDNAYPDDVTTLEDDLIYYVTLLAELVAEAEKKFGNGKSD